ncbi:MAG: hypothetical protein QXN26_07490 [Thermoplasmataceae archaeon]
MKKILVILIVAIVIFSFVSFAAKFKVQDAVGVQLSLPLTPINLNSLNIQTEAWWLKLVEETKQYEFEIQLQAENRDPITNFAIDNFYFVIPTMMNDLYAMTGFNGNITEQFGGSNFDGPSVQIEQHPFGQFGIGSIGANYLGLEYLSSSLDVYAQTSPTITSNGTITQSLSIYANDQIGPVTVYGGSDNKKFTNFYAGANLQLGPITLYGLWYATTNTMDNYLVEATVNMEDYSFGAAYTLENTSDTSYWSKWDTLNKDVPAIAWFDFGDNVEIDGSLNNNFQLNNVTLKGYTTIAKNIQGELDISYSPSSGFGSSAYVYTSF